MEHVIDATNQVLGRLSSQIAHILQGKTHPSYEPRKSGVDQVVVKNISKMVVTGRKPTKKVYRWHTQHRGHLKSLTYAEVFEANPGETLRLAVSRMLPKNRLLMGRMKRLIIEK